MKVDNIKVYSNNVFTFTFETGFCIGEFNKNDIYSIRKILISLNKYL